jgi:2-polyprenyl-3-methyl-5-hydroxy-6-metoxy-1,4-benzoquinol methylase
MPEYRVREMMYGLRDKFRYVECTSCGCLQLVDPPTDWSRYYPAAYYSFQANPEQRSGLDHLLRKSRNRFVCTGEGLAGRLLTVLFPYRFGDLRSWITKFALDRDSRILDVGCGSGELLYDLSLAGYRNLLGVDPFITADRRYANGVAVLRCTIHEVSGEFDLVMFHHSLEHVADQHETMASVARLLKPGGACLVRIPTCSSDAWERYRENWVQLDAPRHLFLHTVQSIEILGAAAGLRLVDTQWDSSALQFFGSEMYERDEPLTTGSARFFRKEYRRGRRAAERLNAIGRGDQAAFYFVKESSPPRVASVDRSSSGSEAVPAGAAPRTSRSG